MEKTETTVTLRLGKDGLAQLNNGVEDIASGRGDYSVGSDDQPLWLWW